MGGLIDFFQYLDNSEIVYAHLPPENQVREAETLEEHMNLTVYYFKKLCKEKQIDGCIKRIIENLGYCGGALPGEVKNFIYRLFTNAVYLHDTGKINPAFQMKVMKNQRFSNTKASSSNHSIYSAYFYIDLFNAEIRDISDKKLRNYLYNILYSFAYIISTHHGDLKSPEDFLDSLSKVRDTSLRESLRYYKRSKGIFEIPLDELSENPFFQKAKEKFYDVWQIDHQTFYILNKYLFSILVTCDYYATYHYFCQQEAEFGQINDIDSLIGCYQSGKIYEEILQNKAKISESIIEELDMNGLRTRIFLEAEDALIKNKDGNIFYLEAPTGGGKTNTSINLALKIIKEDKSLTNIFYVFPFNTLVEQTADTLSKYFTKGKEFAVVNSITGMTEYKNADESVDYQKTLLNRQFMHYPIVATSHVNLFNGLFGDSRESNMLLGRLCNSVVIIDEIQSYKNRIWRQIILMIERYSKLLNIKFIIMSATLPRLDKMLSESISSFVPLLKDSSLFFNNPNFKKRVHADISLLQNGKISIEQLIDHMSARYEKRRGKVLIELIKKKTCREVFKLLKARYNAEVVELSGDDSKYIRKETIASIKNSTNIIVVATQVIEAGVDIDMDYGYKNISLIDGEEQFMGRVNRSALKPDAEAFFFMIDEPDQIYKNDVRLALSMKYPENEKFIVNKDFSSYYEKVMELLIKDTSKNNTDNILNFKDKLLELKFKDISKFMQLIDSKQLQIFLGFEIKVEDRVISGNEVFEKYCELCRDRKLTFSEKKVKVSQMAEEMNYFIFNVEANYEKYLKEPEYGFIYYENGQDFIDQDGKFDREKFKESVRGMFW